MAIGLVVVKQGYRRAVRAEEWSNKYHLTGSDPATPAAWRTLFDALVAEEKKLYSANTRVIRGYGYTDDSPTAHSVWSVDLQIAPNTPVAGTFVTGSDQYQMSDVATWIRWKLDRNNSNGKPIFLRKYYHDAMGVPTMAGSTMDQVSATQVTALTSFATLLNTGAGVGGSKIRDTGGGAIIGQGVSTWLTTRTLKRRGKRP